MKKVLAFLLAACLTIGMSSAAIAEEPPNNEEFENLALGTSDVLDSGPVDVWFAYLQYEKLEFALRQEGTETTTLYENGFSIELEDVTLVPLDKEGNRGEGIHPTGADERNNQSVYGEYTFTFSPPLGNGTYILEIDPPDGFDLTIKEDTFYLTPELPDPVISFGQLDENGEVTVTIALPDYSDITDDAIMIDYYVNKEFIPSTTAPNPVIFQISPTKPDFDKDKYIGAQAIGNGEDYGSSNWVKEIYTFTDTVLAKIVLESMPWSFGMEIANTQEEIRDWIQNYIFATCSEYGLTSTQINISEFTPAVAGTIFDPATGEDGKNGSFTFTVVLNKGSENAITRELQGIIYASYENDHPTDNPGNNPGDTPGGDGGNTGGTGDSGGGSSGSSSSSGNASTSTSSPSLSTDTAKKETEQAVANAIAEAVKNNASSTTANVIIQNTQSVSAATLKAIADAAQKAAAGKGVAVNTVLMSDVVKGNAVESRLYIDPAKATLATDLKLGVTLENAPVTALFEKYFTNEMAVVTFAQEGTFGMPIQVAAKLDLSKLDTKALKFYTYDPKTNLYNLIPAPRYWIDSKGYLHFTTSMGNNVLITDKAMTHK